MMLSDIFQKQSGYSRSFNIKTEDKMSYFKQMTDDNYDINIFLTDRQFSYEVNRDIFSLIIRYR
jgi:hypothetical protein